MNRRAFLALVGTLTIGTTGCADGPLDPSTFTVAGDVMPSWYEARYGVPDDVVIELTVHASYDVVVVVKARSDGTVLDTRTGLYHGTLWVDGNAPAAFPQYMKIEVDGQVDVYERRGPRRDVHVSSAVSPDLEGWL